MRLVCLAVLAACQQTPPPPAPAAKPPPACTAAGTVTLRMERTVCYGRCPAYVVDVAPDGRVTFDGKDFTAVSGKFVSWIPPARVAALREAVVASHFFQQHDYVSGSDCKGEATDNPSVKMTVTLDGRTKSLEHYHGCYGAPQELFALEAAIDLFTDTAPAIGKQDD